MRKVLYIIPTFERTRAIRPVLQSIERAGHPMDVFIMIKQSTPETRKRYDDVLSSFRPNGKLTVVEHENVGYDFIAWRTAVSQFRGQYDDYVFGVDECYFDSDGWMATWYEHDPGHHDMLLWSSYVFSYFPNIRNIHPPYVITDALIRDARNYDVPAHTRCNQKANHVANAEMPWLYALDDFCAKNPFCVIDAHELGIATKGHDIQYSGYDDGRSTE